MSGKKQRTPAVSEWGEPLKLPGTSQRRKIGSVERAMVESIRSGRSHGSLTDLDKAACATARQLARTVDWCQENTEPHTLTIAAGRLSELLTKLRLEPDSRGTEDTGDAFSRLLQDLGTPTFGDTPKP